MKKRLAHHSVVILMFCFGMSVQAQPSFVKGLSPESTNFISAHGMLYFTSGDSLLRSDGTRDGTVLVKRIEESFVRLSNLTTGNYFYFVTQSGAAQSLWKSDGTSGNTVKVGSPQLQIQPLLVFNSELYLSINNTSTGTELWKLTSNDQLLLLKDINPGIGSGYGGSFAVSNNILFFRANEGGGSINLWKTDGTPAGTVLAVDLPFNDFYRLTDVNGTIFFSRSYPDPYDPYATLAELWKTQGTEESTELVKGFEPHYIYNSIQHPTALNGLLYFMYENDLPFHDLWVSDGTEAGTQMIKRVNIDGDIIKMITVNDQLAFYGHTQSFPNSIQKSDGTPEGTLHIHGLSWYGWVGGPYDNVNLTAAGDLLFFIDDIHNASGNPPQNPDDQLQLYQSDLTVENTKPLKHLFGTSFTGAGNVVAAGSNIFFTTRTSDTGTRLWFYDPSAPASCTGTGGILREVWTGLQGAKVSDIPTTQQPSVKEVVAAFEGPVNAGDHYGSRFRGYLCVQETGAYRFMIASNDNSELWLSTSDNPSEKVRIAYVNGYTNPQQYNKYATQQSAPVQLVQGYRYYIEALHKEGVGSDHISVAMQLPDGTIEAPVSGSRLIPFDDNMPPEVRITSPRYNQVFQAPATIEITAEATDRDGTITRVEFYNSTTKIGEDMTAPYSFTWTGVPEGDYTLTVRAFDDREAMTISSGIRIAVRSCGATGRITREVWTSVPGSRVEDIPLNRAPNSVQQITAFEGPSNSGTHYGARVRGYICPPQSGTYTFYISSNDHSELWLSTDSNPANSVRIAYVNGSTGIRQWDKYPSQRSVSITLTQNTKYYIEALHKQGVGSDNLAVAWQLPDGTFEGPIPGSRLSPAESTATAAHAMDTRMLQERFPENNALNIYPNPASSGDRITLQGITTDEAPEVWVEVSTMAGEVVHQSRYTCKNGCSTLTLELNDRLAKGMYIVNTRFNQQRVTRKLVVR